MQAPGEFRGPSAVHNLKARLLAARILILAGDTDGNLGDRAIVTATCQRLRRIDPDAEISLVTSRPGRDRECLGIVPIARGLRGLSQLIQAARRSDLVICGGGGLFQDDDSLAKMPYWALRLLMLRPFSRRIAGLSIGAGPLRYRVSRMFARLALAMLDSISVRDGEAQSVLQPLTSKPVEVVPDPAFLLEPSPKQDARQLLLDAGVPLDRTPLIGVAVRRCFHTSSNLVPHRYASRMGLRRNRGEKEMELLLMRVASALDRVAAATSAHFVFMPTYRAEYEDDVQVCRALARKLQTGTHSILELDDPALYKSVCGLMSAMLCGRMHTAILAAPEGTPITALAYNPKFHGTFSLIGRSEHCIPIEALVTNADQTDRLARYLLAIIDQPGRFRAATDEIRKETADYISQMLAEVSDATIVPEAGRSGL